MSHCMRLLSLIWVVALAACGGGGSSSGTPGLGSPPQPTVGDLVIVLSSPDISNSGTQAVTATVTAVDANRNGIAGVPVTVAIDNNAVISTSSPSTDAAGQVVATIGIGADRTNRTLTVTASASGVTRTAQLRVVTVVTDPAPTADDLTLVLGAASLTNGGSSTVTATATAVDRNRNVVSGIPVTFSVDSGATAEVGAAVTNVSGIVTAQIGIGADRSNRVITVKATSGSLVRTASFVVAGARLTASASPLVVAGSAGNVVEYTLVDFNATPMVGQAIAVTGNGLPTTSGITDLSGKFRYVYAAPSVPGTLEITATAAGDQRSQSITVSAASSAVAPAPEAPQSASVTPTPSVVTVSTAGTSGNQSELRVLFVGIDNRPIPRMRVRFDLAGNLTNTDGTVSWVGDYAYSDENGIARGTFTAGQRSSPTNGVTIRACYDVNDFSNASGSACNGVPLATTATLTVSSEALAVTIGTNNLIKEGRNSLTYIKEYVVLVADSAGFAKADALITPSVDLIGYKKGAYEYNGKFWSLVEESFTAGVPVKPINLDPSERWAWSGREWVKDPNADVLCPNEDQNRNGVRESSPLRLEDMNGNGSLDPRKSDVAITMVDGAKTDRNGIAILQIEYPQNVASWIQFMITVTASGISGTEARAQYQDLLPVLADDLTSEVIPPPFRYSPYGTSRFCINPN